MSVDNDLLLLGSLDAAAEDADADGVEGAFLMEIHVLVSISTFLSSSRRNKGGLLIFSPPFSHLGGPGGKMRSCDRQRRGEEVNKKVFQERERAFSSPSSSREMRSLTQKRRKGNARNVPCKTRMWMCFKN